MLRRLGLHAVRVLIQTRNYSVGYATRSHGTTIRPVEKFYKITNAAEKHNGFQYRDGLNVLKQKFSDDPNELCGPGGLYFTNVKNIIEYMCYGIYLRSVKLPWKKSKL